MIEPVLISPFISPQKFFDEMHGMMPWYVVQDSPVGWFNGMAEFHSMDINLWVMDESYETIFGERWVDQGYSL